MRNLIKSCFDKKDSTYVDYLQMFIDEADNYKKSYGVEDLLKDAERKYFEFIIKTYQSSGSTPSENLFSMMFTETSGAFNNSVEIPIQDLRGYIFTLIDSRVNNYINIVIDKLNKRVKDEGITKEIADKFEKLQSLSNRNKAKDIQLFINSRDEYNLLKSRPHGLITGIRKVDERIGGMNNGTVTTVAGYTGQFKTTWALNIAHLNSYEYGFNIAYISLETPKQDMNWNLLSCHSRYMTSKGLGGKFNYIGHDRMRNSVLSKEEEDYLFDVVEKDLYAQYVDPSDGSVHERGRIVILDESDFSTFSFGEITAVLEKVDDELEPYGGLDALVVDYVQLCKFSDSGYVQDANNQINSYVTFFRRISQNLRKKIDLNGVEYVKQVAVILLAQLNRTGYQKAVRNGGRYDLTALADANELERGSSRVFTTFATEELKANQNAQVQILKNRQGQTMYDPCVVFVEPEAYTFEDEDGAASKTFGGSVTTASEGMASMESMFDSMTGFDMGDFGL